MKKVRFTLNIGSRSGHRETVVEFDDDATCDEINAEYEDWVNTRFAGGWEVID